MITQTEILHEEGYALVGAAMEVYNNLGFGLLEEIYQEALEIELTERKIEFVAKQPIKTFYKSVELRKKYIPDFIVFGELIIELKSVSALNSEHKAQLMNYMRLTRKPVGYLINFGVAERLVWERIVISKF